MNEKQDPPVACAGSYYPAPYGLRAHLRAQCRLQAGLVWREKYTSPDGETCAWSSWSPANARLMRHMSKDSCGRIWLPISIWRGDDDVIATLRRWIETTS